MKNSLKTNKKNLLKHEFVVSGERKRGQLETRVQ